MSKQVTEKSRNLTKVTYLDLNIDVYFQNIYLTVFANFYKIFLKNYFILL